MGGNAAEKKGYVAPDGRIFCWSDGFRCIVAMMTAETGDYVFVAAKRQHPSHDQTLQSLAAGITKLIKDAESKAPSPGAKLGFLKTGKGLLLVWKTDVPNGEDIERYVPLDSLRSLDDMTDEELETMFDL